MVIGLLAYSNTYHVPLVFDDDTSVVNNPVVRNLENFFLNGTGYSYNPRRFVGYLSIALNYRLSGLEVTSYHIFNLAVHIMTAGLVYAFLRLTLQTPFFTRASGTADPGSSTSVPSVTEPLSYLPVLTALLFVAHPVQTQAVTYIIQRVASLATMFYLMSLVLYARGRIIQVSAEPERGKAVMLHVAALVAAALAMRTKEIAVTLPVVALVYETFFFGITLRKCAAFILLTLSVLSLAFLSLFHAGKPLGELLSDVTRMTRVETDISRADYLLTQLSVIGTYLRLLVLPINQNLDYDYPLNHTLFNMRAFPPLLLLMVLLGLALYLFRRSRQDLLPADPGRQGLKTARLISFGIFWFFITLSIESSIIPIADVIFEHRLYLPSIGAFIAIAAAASSLSRRLPLRFWLVASAVTVIVLASATWKRNLVWGDALTLWRDAAEKSPGKARTHLNLGSELLFRGRPGKASEHFKTAARLKPDYAEAYSNLGAAYNDRRMPDKAIEQLKTALRINPDNADALNNVGTSFAMKGLTDYAIAYFQAAIQLGPDVPKYHLNLATAYQEKGLAEKASEELLLAGIKKPLLNSK